MNVWEIISLFFAGQGILTAIFLITRKSNVKHANRIWALFLVLFSLNITYNVLFWAYEDSKFTNSLNLMYLIPFSLYGPLFYLYMLFLVKKDSIQFFRKRTLVHFVPSLLIFANFVYYFSLPVETKILFEGQEDVFGGTILIHPSIVYVFICITLLFYTIFAYKTLKTHFQEDDEMKLWLTLITSVFGLFGISWIIYFALARTGMLRIEHDYFISFFMIFMIGLTSYFGFNYSDVFNGKPLRRVFPIIKYKNSGLSRKVLNELKLKLINLMERDGLYLDCELKLADIADELNVSRHHASQIINECFGVSFYEYLNNLRIQEAEKLLMDNEAIDLNITDIAYKSGFNNRMSFYNTFRKHFGVTPSEFRSKNLAS